MSYPTVRGVCYPLTLILLKATSVISHPRVTLLSTVYINHRGLFCLMTQGPKVTASGPHCLPWAVRAWMLSFPSQNSPSWLPKPCLYEVQSRKKSTEPSSLLWKTWDHEVYTEVNRRN